jgi:hypothetical protein
VIEPRKAFIGEAERRRQSGGNIEALQWSCAEIPPGSMRAMAGTHRVHPGTWESPRSPWPWSREGPRRNGIQACGRKATDHLQERKTVAATVLRSEGNEATREGLWGVGVLLEYR